MAGKVTRMSKIKQLLFENRNISEVQISSKTELYSRTATFVYEKIFNKSSATSLGKTFLEGLLFGVSQNLDKLNIESPQSVKSLFENFKQLPEFSVQSLKEGLSVKDKVIDRLNSSKRCFAG